MYAVANESYMRVAVFVYSADCTAATPLQLQSLLALAFTLAGAAVSSHIRYCCAAVGDQIGGISTALLTRHKDHCRAMSDSLQARYQTVLTTLQRKVLHSEL
jgi:hypothetical protein